MSKVFLGGVPTGPDVRRLIERFGTPEVGTTIPYAEITAIVGSAPEKSRFKSVTGAWRRKLLNEYGIEMAPRDGEAFVVLSERERVTSGVKKVGSLTRQLGRVAKRAVLISTDRVDDETRQDIEALRQHTEVIAKAAIGGAKKLTNALAPPEQMPRALPSGVRG